MLYRCHQCPSQPSLTFDLHWKWNACTLCGEILESRYKHVENVGATTEQQTTSASAVCMQSGSDSTTS